MKKGFLLGFISLGLGMIFSGIQAQKQSIEWSEDYIKENIVLSNIRGRTITTDKFVYEIRVTDFKKTVVMPSGFGLNGIVLTDNGQGYDLVKGDGIFTSDEMFTLTPERTRTISNNYTVYDQRFIHIEDLRASNESGSEVSGPGIKCKIRKCGCPCRNGYTCRACEWWGWQCLELYDCEVSLSL